MYMYIAEKVVHVYVCVYMYMYVRVGMPQKIFNPPPQFSRLGTLCPTLLLFVHLFYWMGGSFSFSSFLSVCLCGHAIQQTERKEERKECT